MIANKIYRGNTEISKAYLNGQIVYGSEVVDNYLLNLGGNIERDYLNIPQIEKTFLVPSSGNFEFGCTVTLSSNISTSQGLLGYSVFSGSSSRYSLHLASAGTQIAFTLRANNIISVPVTPYLGQSINIRCGYYDATPQGRLYINNVLVASIDTVLRPDPPLSTQKFYIGAYGNPNGGSPQNDFYFDGEMHSFFINNDLFKIEEGNGFNTFSNLGTTAFGLTSNAGGLTYWNNNVWQLDQ